MWLKSGLHTVVASVFCRSRSDDRETETISPGPASLVIDEVKVRSQVVSPFKCSETFLAIVGACN